MRKFKATYNSMTATYDCGIYYADTKEEAEREARVRNSGAFTQRERILIHCTEVKN